MRRSKYTAELLAPLVKESRSLAEVLGKLGLKPTGGNYRMLATRLRLANIDTSPLTTSFRHVCDQLTREELELAVADSLSMAQVLTAFQLPTVGRAHHELRRRLRELAIDTSHFRGQGWSRGETIRTHPSVAKSVARRTFTNDEVFIANGPMIGGPLLARRLRLLGWDYCCQWCGVREWRGRPLVLHLDHINGINNDHRFKNLRFLCPNCHSQTPTYSNRRR